MTIAPESNGNWDLCASTRLFASVIGREQAIWLVDRYLKWDRGGHRGKSASVYIPKKLKPDHALIQQIGRDDAERLVAAFGGETFNVSSSPAPRVKKRDSIIGRWWREGASAAEIADCFDLTERHIRNITSGIERGRPANDNAANDA